MSTLRWFNEVEEPLKLNHVSLIVSDFERSTAF